MTGKVLRESRLVYLLVCHLFKYITFTQQIVRPPPDTSFFTVSYESKLNNDSVVNLAVRKPRIYLSPENVSCLFVSTQHPVDCEKTFTQS